MGHPAITAKQALIQFVERNGLRSELSFDVKCGSPPPAQPHFSCTVTVPIFDTESKTFGPKRFAGEAGTKKASEHQAARAALSYINWQGLLTDTMSAALDLPSKPANALAPQSAQLKQPNGAPAAQAIVTSAVLQSAEQDTGPSSLGMFATEDLAREIEVREQLANSAPGFQDTASPGNMSANSQGKVFMPTPISGNEAEVQAQLGNRRIADLSPLQLKAELQAALDKNTQLKSAIFHESQRREKALSILLGI